MKQGLLEIVISMGLQVFEGMLEEDRAALCGPKWAHVPDRVATRPGIFEATLWFRRIRGCRDLKPLFSAIGYHAEGKTLDLEKHVAYDASPRIGRSPKINSARDIPQRAQRS